HIFRHIAAVWMAEAGVPMSEVARFLGYGGIPTTERIYARYSPTHLCGAGVVLSLDGARRLK
ncbi:MAG: tyrosine-type recombinase/integrase, partial [Pseudomonadota bacterium]